MVHLLKTGRKLFFSTPIDNSGMSTEPEGSTRRIHGNISASYYHNLASCMDRSHIIVTISLHQVVAGKELVCREHAVEILPWNAHEFRQTCSRAYENGLESLLVQKRINRNRPSDHNISLDFHSKRLHLGYFSCDHLVLRKSEFRYSVLKHAAWTVKSLKHSHIVAKFGKVARTCKSGRTATDNRNPMAVTLCFHWLKTAVLTCPVCHETLKLSDGHRFSLHSENTASLALGLLRAYPSAYCRQRRILSNHSSRTGKVTGSDTGDESRNLHVHRTCSHAARILAIKTS